jgi:4-diphosphocytidyl-2-C-methyl-D-erythritol kinase
VQSNVAQSFITIDPSPNASAAEKQSGDSPAQTILAPAKVNLTLRIRGRRLDGYHALESLVAFAPFGDELTFWPGAPLGLTVTGPTAADSGPLADNLVLRAVRAAAERIEGLRLGRFALLKQLPAGAGLGGGSADAAAALRFIAAANGLSLDDPRLREAARVTGADIPVCLDPRPRIMRGIGDILSSPLDLPRLGLLIVHPGIAVATAPVFRALGLVPGQGLEAGQDTEGPPVTVPRGSEALLAWLGNAGNDLEAPALAIAPPIADVLAAIAALPGCRLARMSGSGSACFGLFAAGEGTAAAARQLAALYPNWWVRAGTIGHAGGHPSSCSTY